MGGRRSLVETAKYAKLKHWQWAHAYPKIIPRNEVKNWTPKEWALNTTKRVSEILLARGWPRRILSMMGHDSRQLARGAARTGTPRSGGRNTSGRET